MDPHRLAELRSLSYHRAVAGKLRADPSLRDEALSRVDAWLAGPTRSKPYFLTWKQLLEGPFDHLLAVLEEDTERARDLRSCTPFAGFIDPRERWRIRQEVAEAVR